MSAVLEAELVAAAAAEEEEEEEEKKNGGRIREGALGNPPNSFHLRRRVV